MIANDLNFLDYQIQTEKKPKKNNFYSNLLISVSSSENHKINSQTNSLKTIKNSFSEHKKFVPKLLPKKSNIIPSPLILSSSNYKINKQFFTRNKKIPFISLEEKAKTSFNEEEDYFNLSIISNSSSNDFNEDENVFKKIKNSIGSNDDTSCDSEQNKKIIMDGLQINNKNFENNKITILSILEKMNFNKKKNNFFEM
jgi:hypothetical protein